MRSALCRLILLIILLMPTAAYADTEMFGKDLTIGGEHVYNDSLASSMSGKMSLSPASILNTISDGLLGEIRECAGDITILIIIAAISGVLAAFSHSLGNGGASEASFFACFTLMSIAALRCFSSALSYGTQVTGAMTDFITKLSPILMLTLAASGQAVSAAAFQPVMSGAVYVASLVTKNCLVPLAGMSAVLAVAGNISGDLQLTHFCRLVKSIAKWIMAAVITVFTSVTAVYGFSSPAFDAVGGKAAKFAVGSLVPVVGSFLSDTLETVVSGTRLMKNSVGTAGIITVLAICFIPVIKIGVISLMMKITSAVSEPLTDKRISKMMWEVSEAVTTVFAVVVMTAVLFIINISIMIAATNTGV